MQFCSKIFSIKKIKVLIYINQLVTVAERSEACTVFARPEAGIVGSNPTQGMDA
jgi:hypothetical protein